MEVRFGPFRVDPVRRRLLKDEALVPLTPKVFTLLQAFVDQPGRLLTKDMLLRTVWPNVTVEENSLTHSVATLRKALGDDIRAHSFIVTVPGQGYRFVASVHRTEALDGDSDRGRYGVSRLIVLPLKILKADPDTDFLAFSLPDAITSSLCAVESLVVRSSSAAARLASETVALDAIAAQADVDAVLHGTLLCGPDDVRVNAQLVHVPDGTVVWSGMAHAPRGDVFQLQDTLTRRIVDALAIRFTAQDRQRLGHDVPSSGRAYELYLRANQLSHDARHVEAARDLYLQSVEEDPRFAPAWARLGRTYRVIAKYMGDDAGGSFVRGEAAFKRALELNPDLAVAHGLYAYLEADLGRAHDAMIRLLRQRATAADPELLAGLVHVCRYCGLLDESVAAHVRARRIDPTVRTSVAQTYWVRRDFAQAVEADVDSPSYISILAVDGMGNAREASALAWQALRRPNVPRTAQAFISTFRAIFEGDRAGALEGIARCGELNLPDPEATYRFGWMLARLGDDRALTVLRRAAETGFSCPFHLESDPAFDPLRTSHEFAQVVNIASQRQMAARQAFEANGGPEIRSAGMTTCPDWVVPMAAALTQERFTGAEWIFERKFDGVRVLTFRRGSNVRLLSRNRLTAEYSRHRGRDREASG